MVQRLNISLSGDTVERLDQYAYEQHCNSRSQAITHLLWEAKVKNAQLRGQIGLDEYMNSSAIQKAKSKK